MVDDAVFGDSREAVLELVLSSDEEFQGDGLSAEARSENRRAWWREMAARFLPGVEAGALFALGLALIGLTNSVLVELWATNEQVGATYRNTDNALSQRSADPLAPYRHVADLRTLGQAAFGVAAVLVAIVVLTRWQQSRHTRWSRPAAQAALGLGLLGLVFAALVYTGVVAGLPSKVEITSHLGGTDG